MNEDEPESEMDGNETNGMENEVKQRDTTGMNGKMKKWRAHTLRSTLVVRQPYHQTQVLVPPATHSIRPQHTTVRTPRTVRLFCQPTVDVLHHAASPRS